MVSHALTQRVPATGPRHRSPSGPGPNKSLRGSAHRCSCRSHPNRMSRLPSQARDPCSLRPAPQEPRSLSVRLRRRLHQRHALARPDALAEEVRIAGRKNRPRHSAPSPSERQIARSRPCCSRRPRHAPRVGQILLRIRERWKPRLRKRGNDPRRQSARQDKVRVRPARPWTDRRKRRDDRRGRSSQNRRLEPTAAMQSHPAQSPLRCRPRSQRTSDRRELAGRFLWQDLEPEGL